MYIMSQGLFDEETKSALRSIFNQMKKELVDILVVDDPIAPSSGTPSCATCKEAKILAEELERISGGKLRFHIIGKNSPEAKLLKPRYLPAFIYDTPKRNIRYYGLPSGQEFAPFIYIHRYVDSGKVKLPDNVVKVVKEIDVPLHIKIFVTPECPYCPLVVDQFNQFGLVNGKLIVETIEAMENPREADIYGVSYVPDVVITDPSEYDTYGAPPVERINGYLPAEQTVLFLKSAAEKIASKSRR